MNDDGQLVTPTIAPQNVNPLQPDTVLPPSPVLPSQPKKSKKKIIIAILALLLLAGGGTYFYLNKEEVKKDASKGIQALKPAKTQYSIGESVAGYVKYEPTKFDAIKDLKFPKLEEIDPGVNSIIAHGDTISWQGGGIYLYDLVNNTAHKLADSGGYPRIMSDHFLVISVDVGQGKDKKLGAELINLLTGKTKMIFAEAPEDVSGNPCCSVSPDGYKLAFVRKDKTTVWDIRTNTYKDYETNTSPVGEGFSREGADYNVEMSYAQPEWVDNETLVYADKPANKTVLDGSAMNQVSVDTNLFVLDMKSGQSREIMTPDSGIYDIFVNDKRVIINETTNIPGVAQLTRLSINNTDEPVNLAYHSGSVVLGPNKDKLYLFSSMHSASAYSVVDIESGETALFNPSPDSLPIINGISPVGFADSKRMILDITKTEGSPMLEYLAIYNIDTGKIEKTIQIACNEITSTTVVKCPE